MSVNSVNLINSSCNTSGSSSLSQETRAKLIALGIDPTSVTSETQAKSLIQKAQSTQTTQKTTTTDTSSKSGNASQQQMISEAKQLAQKLGISFSENTTLDEMLSLISEEISKLYENAGNDKSKTAQIDEYERELNSISGQYSVTKQNEEAVYMSMSQNADINKLLLGLQ